MAVLGRALRGALGSRTAVSAGVIGAGVGSALFSQDMGTYSMDYIEDALTGQTNVDEVYTGAQRSITSPFTFALSRRLATAASGNVLGIPIIPTPPLGYMSPASTAYDKAIPTAGDIRDGSMSSGEFYMRSQQRRRTPNQAIDGSMVFGMYNLRR